MALDYLDDAYKAPRILQHAAVLARALEVRPRISRPPSTSYVAPRRFAELIPQVHDNKGFWPYRGQ